VVVDNFGGRYRAAEHLVMLGHREIAFIYHPNANFNTTAVRDRYLGYRKALADYHIEFQEDWLVPIEDRLSLLNDEEPLMEYIRFLNRQNRPVAVFAVNDTTAMSLLAAAARAGVTIPDQLAVVGFDNLKMATHLQYSLTTIGQPLTELGVRSAYLLIEQIEGRLKNPEQVVIPTNLIIRESCGARQHLLRNQVEEQAGSS
jgi:DNA-binding LacI/PurR family transcriptional regulator